MTLSRTWQKSMPMPSGSGNYQILLRLATPVNVRVEWLLSPLITVKVRTSRSDKGSEIYMTDAVCYGTVITHDNFIIYTNTHTHTHTHRLFLFISLDLLFLQ
jgi:hypothetical protein